MASHSLVVIGASAGGVAALRTLAAGLTTPLPAPILIVLHVGALPSELPALLNAVGVTPAKHGEDGEVIRSGQIYVAPPDRHMLAVAGRIRLTRGPKENWARPAIDPLFRSAAENFGPAAIGIILTGNLNDGAAGLYEIKRRGGIAIVQDPDDAANPDMPRSAAMHVDLDYCVELEAIPALLERVVKEKEGAVTINSHSAAPESGHDRINGEEFDRPITVTCPDCGGALRRSALGAIVKYACHIGHTYTAEAMAAAQFDEMERVMRSAERILNERAEFCRQMAERTDPSADGGGDVWRAASHEALSRAYTLRDFVEQDWITPHAAIRDIRSERLEPHA
jgi:two-component system chemotaxis response regulator CheB